MRRHAASPSSNPVAAADKRCSLAAEYSHMPLTIDAALALIREAALFFGGASVLVIALAAYLGNFWMQRALAREGAKLLHELGLVKSAYDQHLNLLIDYYALFYQHYRLCQKTAGADAVRLPNQPAVATTITFLESIDEFVDKWSKLEGRIRLLLPERLLGYHMNAIEAFNEFKGAVDRFNGSEESRKEKESAFHAIEAVKQNLESGLRAFLRTEKLLI